MVTLGEPGEQAKGVGGGAETIEVAPPDLTADEAGQVAWRHFGVAGSLSPLASERDQNFRIESPTGPFVLKVSNSAETAAVIEMQTRAMEHVARAASELPVPRVHATREGQPYAAFERKGRRHLIHMVTFLQGEELDPVDLGSEALHGLGTAVARAGKALQGFFHPAAGRTLLWDVKEATRLRPLVGQLNDPDRQALVERVLDGFVERVVPALPALQAQVVHGDLTLTNVLFGRDQRVTAIVDFGDMTHTALICDLAIALAAVLRGGKDTFERAEAVLRGYGTVRPLEEEEAAVLADALSARLAATVVISAWRARCFPENVEYITAFDAESWPVLELFDALGAEELRRRIRRACKPALSLRAQARQAAEGRPTGELVSQRRRLLGSLLEPLSYDRPVHVRRAEGVWMFDADGRRYLDAYNNVPIVGHSHPRVVEAITSQARILNTNLRYLHEAVLELAERLTATMPGDLDTCLFVNSGSEANDLAWRLATSVTGATGGLVSAWAYHGISAALTDLSPSDWRGREQPAHVETVEAPDGYRGVYCRTGRGWAARYASSVTEAAAALRDRGHRPAAMFLDSAWTSDGVFTDATEFLPRAFRLVHETGGLFVADEVQSGFGRLGSNLWGFQRADIAPDFVTLGKPMGNGHPIAALVTRAPIADEFAKRRGRLFSTYGGNPVACAAALAVLDILEEEGLVARGATVGAYLRRGLESVARRHPLVGDVRGSGLLIGVELVEGPEARQPAPDAARTVANQMRARGVLLGTTGRDENVLKIRPPMIFAHEHADQLLETLDGVLAEVERAGPAYRGQG